MKNLGIITIFNNNNYGNRLQNYAVQYIVKRINRNLQVETIINDPPLNNRKIYLVDLLKELNLLKIRIFQKLNFKKYKYFLEFNKNITFSKNKFLYLNEKKFVYDYLVIGSDQVWNPDYRLREFDVGEFGNKNSVKIAFAASLGVDKFPINFNKEKIGTALNKFKAISVREDKGKEMLESITGRKDIEVLIDPTMLVNVNEWKRLSNKPYFIRENKKFILTYFLGDLSEVRRKKLNDMANENDYIIIDIFNKKEESFNIGPAEFLWLEQNAEVVCTDSFHSCVFAFLFNKPFIYFDREKKNVTNMNSRIDTLLSKFKLNNRKYNEKDITVENLKHDYTEAYKILEVEREKSMNFLKKALDIEK